MALSGHSWLCFNEMLFPASSCRIRAQPRQSTRFKKRLSGQVQCLLACPSVSTIMWLYVDVGFLWCQGADDMWVSDGGRRAGGVQRRTLVLSHWISSKYSAQSTLSRASKERSGQYSRFTTDDKKSEFLITLIRLQSRLAAHQRLPARNSHIIVRSHITSHCRINDRSAVRCSAGTIQEFDARLAADVVSTVYSTCW